LGWIAYLESNTAKDLVRVGVTSGEFKARYVTNEPAAAQAVTLFDVLLAREADPGGLATFTNVIASTSWEAAVDAILGSGEYAAGPGTTGVPGGGREGCGVLELTDLVEQFYCRVLHRDVESQASIDTWVTYLRSNTVKDLVRVGILSDEVLAQFVTSKSFEEQAATLYDVLLNRPGDTGGLETWKTEIQLNGWTNAVDAFLGSAEYMNSFGTNSVPGAGRPGCGPSEAPSLSPSMFPSMMPSACDENKTVGDDCNRTTNRSLFELMVTPNRLPYIRVDDEAIDLRLKWSPEDESLIDQSHFLINPSMLFLDDGHGGYEWVRSVRLHSMELSVNGQTSYEGSPLVQERAHMYKSHILLGSEPFRGDLSGGFDFESVSNWGFDTGSPLPVVDSHLYTNEAVGKVNWESDLCEPKPELYLEKEILFRKQVKGPEDPKLVRLPADANSDQQNSWGLSFSSFPPAPSGETLENCKWHEESVFRMYVAPNGPTLL
jgi:hypothetical protein